MEAEFLAEGGTAAAGKWSSIRHREHPSPRASNSYTPSNRAQRNRPLPPKPLHSRMKGRCYLHLLCNTMCRMSMLRHGFSLGNIMQRGYGGGLTWGTSIAHTHYMQHGLLSKLSLLSTSTIEFAWCPMYP